MGRFERHVGAWPWRPYPTGRWRPRRRLPAPDLAVEPEGFVVEVAPGDRIHFLDWGGPAGPADGPGVLLIHGLGQTAWIWAPVARRLRGARPVVAMDLRGHGLSDAPTETGAYDLPVLAEDAIAAAEGSGLLDRAGRPGRPRRATGSARWSRPQAARALGSRCAGVVLVDGGWEALEASTGLDVDEFLRGLDEPPEVLRSMTAFLADREAFDPGDRGTPTRSARRAPRSSRRMPAGSCR